MFKINLPVAVDVSTVSLPNDKITSPDTNYVTEAERFGWAFVFWADVRKNSDPKQGVLGAE